MSAAGPWRRAGLVLLAVLALDQLTKALVRSGVERGSEDSVFPAVTLVHTKNRGVAFSFLEGQTALVLAVVAVAVLALVWYFARHAHRPGLWLPVGLLGGGAVGNVIDRLYEGAVTDFIKLPAWPAFNVADMAITSGVIALVIVVEKAERAADRPA